MVLGNHTGRNGKYAAYGFYPETGVGRDDIMKGNSVNGKVENDLKHGYHCKKTFVVSKDTYNKVLKYINKNKNSKYHIVNYNCTTFAVRALAAGGLSTKIARTKWQIPSYVYDRLSREEKEKVDSFYGYYPGAAGEQLNGN